MKNKIKYIYNVSVVFDNGRSSWDDRAYNKKDALKILKFYKDLIKTMLKNKYDRVYTTSIELYIDRAKPYFYSETQENIYYRKVK